MSRPLEEWEHHVLKPTFCTTEVWCGAPAARQRWDFLGIDHVAASRLQGDRVLPCPACLKAIVETLSR
jgi:hypothetical protein